MTVLAAQTDTATARSATQRNPFKGPYPLGLGDPIFGRDAEISQLLSLLVARRLVLLHAVSGCGKTSLLEAGLRPRLAECGLRGLPTVRFKHFAGEGGLTPAPGNPLIGAAIQSLAGDAPLVAVSASGSSPTLDAELRRQRGEHPSAETPFDCLFFDQFEEVLSAPGVSDAQRTALFKELGRALDANDRWAVFAIRDDYLGALEPYTRFLPTQLSARLRLTQLPLDQAQQAIFKTSEKSAIPFTPEGARKMAAELGASDGTVEPVYLQVACQYVWGAADHASKTTIDADDVVLPGATRSATAGGDAAATSAVEIALREYYDDAIGHVASSDIEAQRRVRQWCSGLIETTPLGDRRRQALWTEQAAVSAAELEALEGRYLLRKERRNGIWIELAHDRLIRPILDSNTIWQSQFRQPWQEVAKRWASLGGAPASPLLIADEDEIDKAEQWAGAHESWVTKEDGNFLELSRAQAVTRRQLREKDEEHHLALRRSRQVARKWVILASAATLIAVMAVIGSLLSAWNAQQKQKRATFMSLASELKASAVEGESFDNTVAALTALLDAAELVTENSQRVDERLDESLHAVLAILQQRWVSRGLLATSLPTQGFVQSLAVGNRPGYVSYITQDGDFRTISLPNASGAGPLLTASDATLEPATPPSHAAADFGFPSASAITPDGRTWALGTDRGLVQVFDVRGKARTPFQDHRHEIVSIALSPSGRYLAASSWLWNFSVRDLSDWPDGRSGPKRLYEVPSAGVRGFDRYGKIVPGEGTQVVRSLAVFENADPLAGGLVAAGRQDGGLAVYGLPEPEPVMIVRGPFEKETAASRPDQAPGHVKPVLTVAFDRTGTRLASGGQDGRIFVWDVRSAGAASGTPASRFESECGGSIESLAFSPDDTILAAGCQYGSIFLLEVGPIDKQGTPLNKLETLKGRVGDVRALAFDPGKRRLFVSGSEMLIEGWYVPTSTHASTRRDLAKLIEDARQKIRPEKALPIAELRALVEKIYALKGPGEPDSWMISTSR